MFQTITCLQEHDLRLVLLAGLICVLGAAASLSAYRRAILTTGPFRLAWTLVLSALLGCSVWATHFVAMLAYQRQLQIGFEVGGTAASIVAVIGAGALGGWAAARWPTPAGRMAAGVVWGLGVAVMHFVGVAAMRLPAVIQWDMGLAAAAVVIGAVGAAATLVVAGDLSRFPRALAAAGLLALAICGLHFTAMGAVTLVPGQMHADAAVIGREAVALTVGALVTLILLAGAGILTIDRFSKQAALSGLQLALDQTPVAIAFFDRDQRLTFWNEPYGRIISLIGFEPRKGLRLRDVLERAVAAHLPPAFADTILTAGAPTEAPRQPPFQTLDGRWYDADHSPTGDGGVVVVLTDVTAHREAAVRDAEARRLAEEASAAKSRFLANMGHEIRTPLNAVLGMVQVLRRDALTDQQRQRIEVIDASGRALLSTLNDLLDLTKIEAGKIDIDPAPFDLTGLLRHVADQYALLAAQKGLAFHLDIEPGLDVAWIGDVDRLRQVLNNLLSNALKFTSAGEVRLVVRRTAHGLRFEVTDTGIGIPDDKLQAVFEKFSQADASTSRRFGGSGLGLAICDELVRLMGGAFSVASAVGQGSCFAFELPMASTEQGDAGAVEAAEALDRPVRILAAEDNPTNQLILSALLEPLDVELTLAANGREAVEAYAADAFDVILMDIQMPQMSGIEATKEIRRAEAAHGRGRAPILALTANVMRHQLDDYRAAGMDGFIAKPIESQKLFAAIDAALSGAPAEWTPAAAA